MPQFPGNGIRNRHLFILDIALLPLATLCAYAVRFEGLTWPDPYGSILRTFLLISVPIKLALLVSFGLYRRLWRFASVSELESILQATGVSGLACILLGAWILPAVHLLPMRVPLGILVMDSLLTAALVALPRLLLRSVMWHRAGSPGGRRVLIAGAGVGGGLLVKQLHGNPQLGLVPIGFVDDDPDKQKHQMYGLPVLGPLANTARLCDDHAVDEVLIAMPNASGRVVRELVRSASEAGVRTRTLPGISDIIAGRLQAGALRDVEIEDLLRREPVKIDLRQVQELATERVVLVTGAGGSIGAELCRQLCRLEPTRLIMLGHGENSIFTIQQELAAHFSHIPLHAVIADVKDEHQLERVFARFRPFSVFHAAAHKHVPLMEENVGEAVLNNVLGTRNILDASAEVAVAHFVMISTDKAVRPTSIMGATKRVAEQLVQSVAELQERNFVAVRFGNVLGSRGSVVPTFLRQIRDGGPVTVTHPEMKRYFMTIPEAVQLVLQAGALGKGGEVFVLDMGEPVKIADLAADLIRLSGKQVGKDIEIRFSGTRPGEKLYEELFFDAEHAVPTVHPKVLRAKNAALPIGVTTVVDDLLGGARQGWPEEELRGLLKRLVPDFEPSLAGMPVRQEPKQRESGGVRRVEDAPG